jgi:gamma-glutamyltranspeptidase/glutathione hydrolase
MHWTRTRPVVAGCKAAVASAHPLASRAGLAVLEQGGNAVDAAVAMAVALGVVEPYMSGPAGVGFLLLHRADGPAAVLNFSGHAPQVARPEAFTPETQERGPRSCLVPGNVAGWLEALARFGTRRPADIFAPAIELAHEGFPLHPFNVVMLRTVPGRLDAAGMDIHGAPPRIGAILRQPDLARSLERIVIGGADEFYRGELGRAIADHVQAQGGFLAREDLAGYRPQWETPIAVPYRGLTVRTCPPNNEGFQILQTLKILEGFDLAGMGHNTTEYVHVTSEAVKLAVADRIRWGGDPAFRPVPLDRLLDDDYAAERRKQVNRRRASSSEGERWRGTPAADKVPSGAIEGLTTHLAAVDPAGNVASITQSLGGLFGSGVFVPSTGIALNNFANWCEIDPRCTTPNLIQPGKRWASCMAPLHVLAGDRFWFSVSTPGSYGILQTALQMALNVIEFGADVQAAIEAPRFRVWEDTRMQVEDRLSQNVRDELARRGHAIELVGDYAMIVGGGQAVMIDPDSTARLAGADPRRDGYALAY